MASGEREYKYCGSKESSLTVYEEGNTYQRRTKNPYEEDSWICGRCYRHLLYRNALPPSHVRRGIRIVRIAKRACHKCGGKTFIQKSKTSSNDYRIWHRHPKVLSEWLCGRCYANWLFEPKRRFTSGMQYEISTPVNSDINATQKKVQYKLSFFD